MVRIHKYNTNQLTRHLNAFFPQLDQFAHPTWIIIILLFTVAHTHSQSDSIQYSTITSIIYTKPPLSSRVLTKAWSTCKRLCKVASIAVIPYCIHWLQTDYLHLYAKPAAKQVQRIFRPVGVLSVTQTNAGTHDSGTGDTFPPQRETHSALPAAFSSLLCVCLCVLDRS